MTTAIKTTLRQAALAHFEQLGYPTRRQENWRHTDVTALTKIKFTPDLPSGSLPEIPDLGGQKLVFVDGHFAPELSTATGITNLAAQDATTVGQYVSFEGRAFTALNTAYWQDGAYLKLAAGVQLKDPIHLVFLTTPSAQPRVTYPRNLLILGSHSQATIIEHYLGQSDTPYFTCPVTEIVLETGANLSYCRLQQEQDSAFHLATTQLNLAATSCFKGFTLDMGGSLVRHELTAELHQGSSASLDGLYLVHGTQKVDNHLWFKHLQPHTTSQQRFRGILDGKGEAVFNGNIYVYPHALKTDARQNNRNLLLSPGAQIHTNPQLEIYADDVKCAHGATIGQLDPDQVFYLRSRGLDEAQARSLLTYAFASDLLTPITLPQLQTYLESLILDWLPASCI